MILAKMEEHVQAHWNPLFVPAGLGSQAHPLVILRMMSAALARVTRVAPWNAWTWIINLNASAGRDTKESSVRLMWMTVSQAHAETEGNVKTLWEIMNVVAHKDGSENNAKLTEKDVMNPLVKTTLCVWTFSRISSVLAHRELMANAVKLHPRDALETLA